MLLSIPELIAQASSGVNRIKADDAYAESKSTSAVFIDVREPGEVANKGIPGSVNIPRGVLEMKIAEVSTDPKMCIFVHCATGARAVLASEQLQRLGYENVRAISCALDTIETIEAKHR